MRIIFVIILLLHGLIHLMGFVKAFNLAEIEALTHPISQTAGLFWLLACFLMLTTAGTYFFEVSWWTVVGIAAVLLSQLLIILSWEDAKFGTIANVIILIAVLWKYF